MTCALEQREDKTMMRWHDIHLVARIYTQLLWNFLGGETCSFQYLPAKSKKVSKGRKKLLSTGKTLSNIYFYFFMNQERALLLSFPKNDRKGSWMKGKLSLGSCMHIFFELNLIVRVACLHVKFSEGMYTY